MKIEEFKKYKRLIESNSTLNTDESKKVYEWMEETGRIDEGLFSGIWSWLKRNFSPTSIELHKLANEFEKEIKKEMEAEFSRKGNYHDKAAQMRASWAGRISGDIEKKMYLIADEDPDYRELVDYLINKKTYSAKKQMLKYLDTADITKFKTRLNSLDRENERKGKKIELALTKNERNNLMKISDDLVQDAKRYNSMIKNVGTTSSMKEFIKAVVLYSYVQCKYSNEKFDIDVAKQTLEDVISIIEKIAKKLSTSSTAEKVLTSTFHNAYKVMQYNKEDKLSMEELYDEILDDTKKDIENDEV